MIIYIRNEETGRYENASGLTLSLSGSGMKILTGVVVEKIN